MSGRLLAILDSHGIELHALLVRLTLRVDVANDLFQDLFIRMADSQVVARAVDPWAYVRRAAINLAFDWRRRQARGRADEAVLAEIVDPRPPVWMRLEQREQIEQVLSLAADLPELTREAFVLRYVHDLSYEEVGQALDRTSHQARGLCHAGVQEIRRRMAPLKVEVSHE